MFILEISSQLSHIKDSLAAGLGPVHKPSPLLLETGAERLGELTLLGYFSLPPILL